jgi:KaiC/GvpD/RAD55 family RecA-like ATPase
MRSKDTNDGRGDLPSGIPRGNTVAVVGDPGTGKTTFLLTYVTCGNLEAIQKETSERKPTQWVVRLETKEDKDNKTKTFQAINQLFVPAIFRHKKENDESQVKYDKKKMGTLRCFISLENNLSRVFDNHGALLACWKPCSSNDQFVFIDATAFLSGRLEDRLRYPRLARAGQESPHSDCWSKHSYDLNLGGHNLDEDEYFGLYYQVDNQEPKRIEQLKDKTAPFLKRESDNNKPIRYRSFNLITRPLSDPFQRVRLLKDLLAEIFVRFSKCSQRLLAIDSLSALMNPFGENELSANTFPAKRLNILNLVRWLEEYGVTTFLACEAEGNTDKTWSGQPLFLGTEERYLASGVIQLNYHEYPSGDIVRYLRVLKMRGTAHDMRPHAYDLSEKGIAWVEPLFGEAGKKP